MKLKLLFAIGVVLALASFGESSWGPSGCAASGPVGSWGFGGYASSFYGQCSSSSPSSGWISSAPVAQAQAAPIDWGPWEQEGGVGTWFRRPKPKPRPSPLPPKDGDVVIKPNDGKTIDKNNVENFGVDLSKISQVERTTSNGFDCQIGDVGDDKLTDDSTKGYFVVISKDAAKREAVLKDWEKLPQHFRDKYKVWSSEAASPDHYLMQDRATGKPRFHVDGDPTVVLQDHAGKVMFRHPLRAEQVYEGAKTLDFLLRTDPSYKPDKDPGVPSGVPGIPNLPPLVWLGGAAGAVILIRRAGS